MLWRLLKRRKKREVATRYVKLAGDGRREMLKIYANVEKLLRQFGAASRAPGQTFAEHTALATAAIGATSVELNWLQTAAWEAAYDPSPFDPHRTADARDHFVRLKASLKSNSLHTDAPEV